MLYNDIHPPARNIDDAAYSLLPCAGYYMSGAPVRVKSATYNVDLKD